MRNILLCIVLILILGGSLFFLFSQKALAQDDYICAVYFTYIGCPNCAYTDPVVLTEWTEKYHNLVVIEYMWQGGDWEDPNSQFFGEYAEVYRTQAAVPQIVIDKNNIKLGRIDVPTAEKDIKTLKSNPCLLKDKSVTFEDLKLNQLQGKPKIWANERILISLGENEWLFQWNGKKISEKLSGEEKPDSDLLKRLLFADDVSKTLQGIKFDVIKPQRSEFSGVAFSDSTFIAYQDFENAIKINLSEESLIVESSQPEQPIEEQLTEEEVELPIIGKIKTGEFSLPILTFLLGLADGFNPCAFFILTFLLAALLGLAGARKKILLVGGVFIFFSALFYFLFMAVLLNVFKLGKEITILTLIAGLIAMFVGIINIKDYFSFQKGISLTLPKGRKLKFMERVKSLSLAKSTLALTTATVVIAATVNIYELLCTFGFPMIYTRILTLRGLPSLEYYLYLIFYTLVYIIPLTVIVLIFAITLGKRTFSEIWVRRLKLISGFMILFLGGILIFQPKLLESISTAFSVLILAILIAGAIILVNTLYFKKKAKSQT